MDPMWLHENQTSYPLDLFGLAIDSLPIFQRIVKAQTTIFGLKQDYVISGNPQIALIATYSSSAPSSSREFQFILIEDLEHNYPNGKNHALHGATLNWGWMKQNALP